MTLGLDHLGSQVLGRPAECPSSFFHDLGKPEVRQFDVPFEVQERILRLQISIDYVKAVKVPERQQNLTGVESNLVVRKTSFSAQVRKQLAAV
eukprot:CAMPEP_0181400452 /NCGR_PEP_ID=MMETSP1110-20121109/2122_1 /TAXON_ID=174948 /ORGANISM="Symbiodinium sp., Strain CCMP421" /LENGTH=92 /DNA_ID=CAMNT_0023522551 /DNA_START=476 /DNA_END=754 /DNA_ORIENTATION=+